MAEQTVKDRLQLIKERDKDALKALFAETNPYLLRLAYSQNVFQEAAEEVIQDAWKIFFDRIEEFQGLSQIKTFIAGIMINKIREHRRDQKKMIPEEDHEKILDQAFTRRGWWAQEPSNPEKLFQSKEIARSIQDCLEGLSEQQRDAFSRKEIEQDTTESICSELKISASNLGVLLFRAKEKLRLCLGGRA